MDKEKKKSTEASEAQAPAADTEKTPVPEKATEADNAAKASTEGTTPEADEKSEKTTTEGAAFKSGVRGEVVEDAVCLALHDAKKTGEVSEKSVAQALKGVLNRHPEWKQESASAGNFRVGAESGKMPNTASDEISKIFGNT